MKYEPVVDMQGVDQEKYYADLQTCYGYADQVDPLDIFAKRFAGDLLIGAAAGAAIGAVAGNAGTGAAAGSAIGATAGAIDPRETGHQRQVRIINNCLTNRGYKILG